MNADDFAPIKDETLRWLDWRIDPHARAQARDNSIYLPQDAAPPAISLSTDDDATAGQLDTSNHVQHWTPYPYPRMTIIEPAHADADMGDASIDDDGGDAEPSNVSRDSQYSASMAWLSSTFGTSDSDPHDNLPFDAQVQPVVAVSNAAYTHEELAWAAGLPDKQRRVYRWCVDHRDIITHDMPSLATVADDCSVSRETVRPVINEWRKRRNLTPPLVRN